MAKIISWLHSQSHFHNSPVKMNSVIRSHVQTPRDPHSPTNRTMISLFKGSFRLHLFCFLSTMAQFSLSENINGLYSLLKAELVDAPIARSKPAPDVDITGKVILMTGATSGTHSIEK